jgi:hypothetical protein
MDWVNRLYGLHLDYYPAFYDEVDAVSDLEFLALIDNRQRDFCCYLETSASDLVSEAGLISAFQKTGAQNGMDFRGGCDHSACDLICSERGRVCSSSHDYHISQFLCVTL